MTRTNPKVQTMVAPVGRSKSTEKYMPENRDEDPHDPAQRETRANRPRIQHRPHRRHDQIAEHQQHPGNRHRPGDHEAERRIEQEIPEAHGNAARRGPPGINGDLQETLSKDPVENADGRNRCRPSATLRATAPTGCCRPACPSGARLLPSALLIARITAADATA